MHGIHRKPVGSEVSRPSKLQEYNRAGLSATVSPGWESDDLNALISNEDGLGGGRKPALTITTDRVTAGLSPRATNTAAWSLFPPKPIEEYQTPSRPRANTRIDRHVSLLKAPEQPNMTTLIYSGINSPRFPKKEVGSPPASSPPQNASMWEPFWLRKIVLIMFAVGFFCLALITGLLYQLSSNDGQGLRTEQQANHLAWKFGPTALFVVVGVLWKQVDHAVKISMPWKELAEGPSMAHKTLVLDYVSPWPAVSAWRAVANKHWAAVTTLLGWLLLILTTIFSTGLFDLQPTLMTRTGVDIPVSSEFNAEGYDFRQVGSSSAELYYAINFRGLPRPTGSSVGTVVGELGVLEEKEDENSSGPKLKYTTTITGATIEFDCEVLPIQNATKTRLPWFDMGGSNFWTVNVTHAECNITNAIVAAGPTANSAYAQPNGTQNYQGRMRDYTCNNGVNWQEPVLSNLADYTEEQVYNNSLPHRVLLSVADLRFPPQDSERAQTEYLYINNLTVALCQYDYKMDSYRVESASQLGKRMQTTLDRDTATGDQVPLSRIPGLTTADLGLSVYRSSEQADFGRGGPDHVLSTTVEPFFRLMTMKENASSIGAFMNPNTLISAASDVFKGVGSQVISLEATRPSNSTTATSGTITYVEDRLHVTRSSTAAMCTLLGVLTLLSMFLVFVRPTNVAPREPGSIAAAAAILAASPALERCLLGLGSSSSREIHDKLSTFSFQSNTYSGAASAFVVKPLFVGPRSEEKERDEFPLTQKHTWWRPASGAHWFVGLVALLPVAVIAFLEVFQGLSNEEQGLVGIGPSDVPLLAAYIPTAMVIGLAGLYSCFGSVAIMFAPFSALKGRNVLPERSISLNLGGKMTPYALFLALKTRHFGVAVAIVANILGGFIVIVTSGLYSVVSADHSSSVQLAQSDMFDLSVDSRSISIEDHQAMAMTGLIKKIGTASPQWTYESLVFNGIQLEDIETAELQPQTLSVTATALRPKLDCRSIPSSDRRVSASSVSDSRIVIRPGMANDYALTPEDILVQVNTTLPWDCSRDPTFSSPTVPPSSSSPVPSSGSTRSPRNWLQYFILPRDNNNASYVGKGTTLGWFADSENVLFGDGAVDTNTGGRDNNNNSFAAPDGFTLGSHGCPTVGFTIGTIRAIAADDSGSSENDNDAGQNRNAMTSFDVDSDLATLVCHQRIEEVRTAVTFDVSSLSLSESSPPQPDEPTARLVVDEGTNSTAFEFPVNRLFWGGSSSGGDEGHGERPRGPLEEYGIRGAGEDGDAGRRRGGGHNDLDAFMRLLLTERNANTTLESLAGEVNAGAFRRAVERLYGVYVAQAISANMRVVPRAHDESNLESRDEEDSDSSSSPFVSGQLTTPASTGQHRRLRQNAGLKLALQVLLGLMTACILAAQALIRIERVLPHDPSSIAGVATLVAGSEMVRRNPDGRTHGGGGTGGTSPPPLFPRGAEWLPDREMKKAGQFRGRKFGMTWWNSMRDGVGQTGVTVAGLGRRERRSGKRFGVDVEDGHDAGNGPRNTVASQRSRCDV